MVRRNRQIPDFDDCWDDWDDDYEDPPLYPEGYVAGLTDQKLYDERAKQNRIHDAAVDREAMGSPTIENAHARAKILDAEMMRRGLYRWADTVRPVEGEPEYLDSHGAHA